MGAVAPRGKGLENACMRARSPARGVKTVGVWCGAREREAAEMAEVRMAKEKRGSASKGLVHTLLTVQDGGAAIAGKAVF